MAKCLLFDKKVSSGYTDLSRLPNDFLRNNHTQWKTNYPYNAFSKHGNSNSSTINADIYDALLVYTGESSNGAVGLVGDAVYTAEYTRKVSVGAAQMLYTETVVFNAAVGLFKYICKDEGGRITHASLLKKPDNRAVFFLAMFPFLTRDEELKSALENLPALDSKDAQTNEYLAKILLICDNIYRQIEMGIVHLEIPADGNIFPLPEQELNNGVYIPQTVIAGEFKQNKTKKKKTFKTVKDAKTVYWKERNWSSEEQMLVPVVDDKMKVPPEVIELAEYINATSEDLTPARNFMLRGITGYGKSTIVTILGAITNTPVVRMTCHPTMETNDFLTKYVPDCSEYKINAENIPSFDDIANDPETAYQMMTGEWKKDVTCEECLKAYGQLYASRSNNGPRFKLVESDYVKALSKGWIIELQEPSVIMNGGVLTGLNEFDHIGSVIPMPDGSYRKRHKDAVVIYTDNVTYEGCRPLNQSVIRRNFMAFDLYKMSKADVINRIKYNTKYKEQKVLEEMYKVWLSIQKYCQENAITDGSVSIVELENWALAMRITGDFKGSCRRTVISKANAYPDEQEMIVASCLDTAASVLSF